MLRHHLQFSLTNLLHYFRMILEVILPDNPIYTPLLEVKCYDKRLGSVNNILLGSASISLSTKLEWNTGVYVASDKQKLLEEALRIKDIQLQSQVGELLNN